MLLKKEVRGAPGVGQGRGASLVMGGAFRLRPDRIGQGRGSKGSASRSIESIRCRTSRSCLASGTNRSRSGCIAAKKGPVARA